MFGAWSDGSVSVCVHAPLTDPGVGRPWPRARECPPFWPFHSSVGSSPTLLTLFSWLYFYSFSGEAFSWFVWTWLSRCLGLFSLSFSPRQDLTFTMAEMDRVTRGALLHASFRDESTCKRLDPLMGSSLLLLLLLFLLLSRVLVSCLCRQLRRQLLFFPPPFFVAGSNWVGCWFPPSTSSSPLNYVTFFVLVDPFFFLTLPSYILFLPTAFASQVSYLSIVSQCLELHVTLMTLLNAKVQRNS